MTDDLFANSGNDLPITIDPNKDYYAELTGPGGKFHDSDETVAKQKVARAKIESDNYIKTLERQLDVAREDDRKLREEYQAAASLRELIDQYKEMQQLPSGKQPIADPEVRQPVLDEAALDARLEQKFALKEAERQFQTNMQEVKSKLEAKYGPNYQNAFKQHVEELGLDADDVKALIRKSPKALYKTLGLDEVKSDLDIFQAPPRSQTRSDSFKPQTDIRDWAFYEKMRVENPKLYKNPRTHVQMHKDATEIDERYGAGTFMRRK